jgi:glucan phosphoethanolaminetransferase (alkaline phosphatase superfamily)
MGNTSSLAVVRVLGYAGLIPFVCAALLVVSASPHAPLAAELVDSYALAIICFLFGSWWGMAQSSAVRTTLFLSNAFVLLALALYLFAREWWPLAAAWLLLGAWLCEQSRSLFPVYAPQYRFIRTLLTLVAASSMGLVQLVA